MSMKQKDTVDIFVTCQNFITKCHNSKNSQYTECKQTDVKVTNRQGKENIKVTQKPEDKPEDKPENHEEQISKMEHKRTGEQAEEHRRRMDKSRLTTGQKQNYIFYKLNSNITMLQSYQQVDIK